MVSIIDIFNPNTVYVDKQTAQKRYDMCKSCAYFLPTTQCRKCGCFMKLKVKISDAECPIGNW